VRTELLPASIVLACARVVVSDAQKPSFFTRVEAVRVDVLVTERGRSVRGLQPTDFEVRDNGVLQQVDVVSFEQIPLNVVLALDMSGSVSGERLDHLRKAGGALLDALTEDDQAALVTFTHVVAQGSGLTTDRGRVRVALDLAQAAGETALVDGSYAGMMVAESDVGRALLMVFSDGLDTSSWLSPEAVLETARRSDVVAYSVSVGRSYRSAFLRELSALTGGKLLEIESTQNLSALFLRILDEFRQRYLVSYTPRGVAKDGWHRLEVRVKRRNVTIKARPGYLAGPAS
jgi:VWFA-related protein